MMDERGPSVTAAVVAATLLLLRDDADLGPLIHPPSLAPLEMAVRGVVPALGLALDHIPWRILRRASLAAEKLLSPGFVAHYALRKNAVRAEILRAIDEGHRQVVLVGAGFDMLGGSLPEGVRVFEVDHPTTQAAKIGALRGTPPRDVTFVPLDLAVNELGEALARSPGYARDADTVFVAEGLLMYLTAARVGALLRDFSGRGTHRTRSILTVITPDASGRPRLQSQRRAVDLCMRWLGEPFVWGASRDAIVSLLAQHGLTAQRIFSTLEVRDSVLHGRARRRLPRATGEIIVVADGGGAVDPPASVTRAARSR